MDVQLFCFTQGKPPARLAKLDKQKKKPLSEKEIKAKLEQARIRREVRFLKSRILLNKDYRFFILPLLINPIKCDVTNAAYKVQ